MNRHKLGVMRWLDRRSMELIDLRILVIEVMNRRLILTWCAKLVGISHDTWGVV